MSAKAKVKLTKERIRQFSTPPTGEATLWDTEVLGLGVRCLPSGVKSYIVSYRSGYGRSGTARRITLGKVESLRLEDAREAALEIRGAVLKGRDPVEERRLAQLEAKKPKLTLSTALERYSADQERRGVKDRKSVSSSLNLHLLGHVGDVPLHDVDRRSVVEAVTLLETKPRPDGGIGFPGAAKALRSNASTFLKWCADQGMISANPLQGYRAARKTREQRLQQPGRELRESELIAIWSATKSEEVNPAFGALLRVLILTGQRKTETARMRWEDLDLAEGLWRIPKSETKNGVAHEVPLPKAVVDAIQSAPRVVGDCPWVFSTNGKTPMSGWSKLTAKLRDALGAVFPDNSEIEHWTLHDLRRTFRSGLTRLGVNPEVAEIMLNHRPETLIAVYDREPRLGERREAAERWALHVSSILDPDAGKNVVQIGRADSAEEPAV
ncbi:site-specific integrase [uncultured Tateyamaria sp.]|uniref:tyrosine-type recombinase/integrase n=1 Tax=uncultured Tateyamaria sp. TaxID=455651 RepID=UPI00261BA091|nr:site-specific integrase [uncultured Tateyamaria sp.]